MSALCQKRTFVNGRRKPKDHLAAVYPKSDRVFSGCKCSGLSLSAPAEQTDYTKATREHSERSRQWRLGLDGDVPTANDNRIVKGHDLTRQPDRLSACPGAFCRKVSNTASIARSCTWRVKKARKHRAYPFVARLAVKAIMPILIDFDFG